MERHRKKLSNSEHERMLEGAVAAYATGTPVVVLAKDESVILHGEDTLQSIARLNLPLEAFVVTGVDVDEWNASDWPGILEAGRLLFVQNKWPDER